MTWKEVVFGEFAQAKPLSCPSCAFGGVVATSK